MICAKKTDGEIKQSGGVDIGVGFDVNFGRYYGHIIRNTANPFGGDKFCETFHQPCTGPALRPKDGRELIFTS